MTTIYNCKHESLPRLRGEYQMHLRTYKFDADDIDVTKPTVANPNAFDELDDLLP